MKIVAKGQGRKGAMWVGIACAILGVGAAAALGATGRAIGWVAGAGVGVYMVALVVAMVPQKVVLEVTRDSISTGRVTVRNASLTLGHWALPSLGAPMGVVAEFAGDGGRIRIGGLGHAGQGLGLDPASGVRFTSVDAQVSAAELDEILAVLGLSRSVAADVAIGLVPFGGGFAGALTSIWPWLATIVAAGLFGAVCSAMGVMTRYPFVPSIGTAAIVLTGLVVTIARSRRVRGATRVLKLAADGLALVGADGRELVRCSWSAVSAVPARYFLSGRGGSWWFPQLELTLGSYPPLCAGAWDGTLDWGASAARSKRLPKWLVGSAQWPLLVAALRAHGRL